MSILKVFVGFDPRVNRDFTVLQQSIHMKASKPVAVIPLMINQLPIKRRGLTDFTYTRYLVPYLCNFQHNEKAIFMDSDMLVVGDVHELAESAPTNVGVSVVKNKEKFEWASMMVFNCGHGDCKKLTPEWIDDTSNSPQSFDWAKDVGELPKEWNYCIGYDDPEKGKDAKLLHYTMGTPGFEDIRDAQVGGEDIWQYVLDQATSGCGWMALHMGSVHRDAIVKRILEVTSRR